MLVVAPGAGEVIGDAPDRRVEILSAHPSLHVTWSRFGPRRDGADLHVHHRHTDLFYVLAGEMTVRLGPHGDEVGVAAGTLARVPPLVVHGFRNGTDLELRYLNLHVPGAGFADYMRGLRDRRPVAFDQDDPPADGGRPAGEAVGAAAEPAGDGVVRHAEDEVIAVFELHGGTAAPAPGPREVRSLYVLEGELAVVAGRREVLAPAGTWVQAPAAVPVTVAARAGARHLHVRTPAPQPSGTRGA